jgi:branched-chain amino acid transport system ATP-binding protein
MLELKDVRAGYAAGDVLQGVSLRVAAGEVVGLLGRNGMGKTTILKSVLGLAGVRAGSVRFRGRELSRLAPYQIPRLGIGYVPQDRKVFPQLGVRENLTIGWRRAPLTSERLQEILQMFPQLEERLDQRAGTLSGGEQQMLAIARALLMEPALILLDEPTEGLMPVLVARMEQLIHEMKEQGLGILLAEQRLETALRVCDRVYVLEKGRVVWEGAVSEGDLPTLRRHLGLGLEPPSEG